MDSRGLRKSPGICPGLFSLMLSSLSCGEKTLILQIPLRSKLKKEMRTLLLRSGPCLYEVVVVLSIVMKHNN